MWPRRPSCDIAVSLLALTMRHSPNKTKSVSVRLANWEKSFADGFRSHVWWPGPGIEALSYAAGYEDAQSQHDGPKLTPLAVQSQETFR